MMSKSEKAERVKRRGGDRVTTPRALPVSLSPLLPVLLLLAALIITTGCRRDMQDQPKMKPYRGTSFFGDGLSARQPVKDTVPRGFLRQDTEYFTGKKSKTTAGPATQSIQGQQGQGGQQAQQAGAQAKQAGAQANTYPDDIDVFPIPVTEDVVKRGRDRYNIFCVVCHGYTGNGDGMVVRRGFRRAASFNDDRLRQAPVGHFFDAMTNGWGAMPSYASQIPVQDRWAIIAYIRALQLSQQNNAMPSASPAASASPARGGHQ